MCRQRRCHVRLDLTGAEWSVVDADFVDQAVEEAAGAAAVGADPPAVGVADVAAERLARDLGAVDVEAGGGAVVAGAQVLPLAAGRRLAAVEVVREAGVQGQVVAAAEVVDPEHRAAVFAAVPAADDAVVELRAALFHPRLEGEPELVEGAQRRQIDARAAAVETQRRPKLARHPTRAPHRRLIPVPRRITRDRARTIIERVGRDRAARRRRRGDGDGDGGGAGGVAGRVAGDGGEDVRAGGGGAGVPAERVGACGVFAAEVDAVELELDAGDAVVVAGAGADGGAAADGRAVGGSGDRDARRRAVAGAAAGGQRRLRRNVAGGVERLDRELVAGVAGEAAEGVGGRGRRADLAAAAVEVVAGDGDVVA